MIRRPVFAAAAVFAFFVYLSILIWPPGELFPEKADGRYVVLTGVVEWKEFRQKTSSKPSWQSESPGETEQSESPGEAIQTEYATEKSGSAGDSERKLRLQISLRNVQIESGIPKEIEYEIHHDDKVLCALEEDLAGQDAATAPGSMVRMRGKIRIYKGPTNDGQFDSRLYYQQIQGYLFSLTDAEVLAYSETGNPLKACLYRLRRKLSSLIDDLYSNISFRGTEDMITFSTDDSGAEDSSIKADSVNAPLSSDSEESDLNAPLSSDSEESNLNAPLSSDSEESNLNAPLSSDSQASVPNAPLSSDLQASIINTPLSSESEASILKAMLLGETGLLDPEIKEMYQMNGIIHIVCISGLHISLIGMGLFKLLRRIRIPVPPAAAAASAVIFLYSEMTGMHSSSFRAMIMFFLHLLALLLGRTYDLLTALSLAAILLLIEQPMYICYSGFLFSFGAVIAIGALAPALPKYLRPFAVSIVSLPIQLCSYYTFPLYSVLLNLIVLPLMTLVMGAGLSAVGVGAVSYFLSGGTVTSRNFESAILGSICSSSGFLRALEKTVRYIAFGIGHCLWPVARIAAGAVSVILKLYEALCVFSQNLSGHTVVPGCPPTWTVVLYYAVLAAMIAAHEWRTDRAISRKAISRADETALYVGEKWRTFLYRILRWPGKHRFDLIQTGAAAAVIMILLFVRANAPMTFCVLDVGQGDGLFIRGKVSADALDAEKRNRSRFVNILVDGGSSSSQQTGRYILKPFLHFHGVSYLDLAIVTHDDWDHCSGLLELLEEAGTPGCVTVGAVALPDIEEDFRGSKYRQIENLAEEKGIRVLYLSRGQSIVFAKDGFTAQRSVYKSHSGEEVCESLGGEETSEEMADQIKQTPEVRGMAYQGLQLYCLHPSRGAAYDDTNACSMTLLLKYRGFSGLLTGDLEKDGEEDFVDYTEYSEVISQELKDLDFLKVAHHGSAYATGDEFLEEVQAGYALVSCGKNNRYGHPAPETVERILNGRMQLLDTRMTGQITFLTDGKIVKIRTFCP